MKKLEKILPLETPKKKPRSIKQKSTAKQDTNNLTNNIVKFLNMSGFVCWRQNNVGVYDAKKGVFRANNAKKGISDIIGYEKKNARFISVEVKTGKDVLSEYQKEFLDSVSKNGGIAIIARNFDDFLKEFQELIKT